MFSFLFSGLYIYKYHSLALEGWRLFNDRCNTVNPELIKVRNTHLALGAAISGKATPSAQQFETGLKSLPEETDQYLKLEKVWLDNQNAYLNRWDFKLLEPEYMKTAGKYQLAMYQGYYDYYKTVSSFFSGDSDNGNTLDLMDKYYSEIHTNRDLYDQAFDTGVKTKDWRKVFAQVPEPNCPEESLIIPEYYSPTPTSVPSTNDSHNDIKS